MRRIIINNVHKYTKWLDSMQLKLTWNSIVKDRKALQRFIMKIVSLVVHGKKTTSLGLSSLRFATIVVSLYKSQGESGVSQYLSKCNTLLMQAIAMEKPGVKPPVLSTSPRVATTLRGIPRIIPKTHRKQIRNGDPLVIQYWLTLFSLYRVLACKRRWRNALTPIWRNRFRTEEDAPVEKELYGFISRFVVLLRVISRTGRIGSPNWEYNPIISLNSGPNSSKGENGFACIGKDAVAWSTNPLYRVFHHFCKETGMEGLTDDILSCSYMVHPLDVSQHKTIQVPKPGAIPIKGKYKPEDTVPKETIVSPPFLETSADGLKTVIPSLGRLSFKLEARGKVRVFALMDFFTQQLFRPLHDWIFCILKWIPQDATFDQDAAIRAFRERMKKRGPRSKVYSFDLSSATDRLPLIVQVRLLGALLENNRLAVLWGLLLVGRAYYFKRRRKNDQLPQTEGLKTFPELLASNWAKEYAPEEIAYLLESKVHTLDPRKDRITYAVGQPMGALSSWAALAITHHFIVQYAHYRSRNGQYVVWFSDYLVLGDDVVIADTLTANEYRRIMDGLGVQLSDAKYLPSDNGSFEFAKRVTFKGHDVSPFSFLEMRVATKSLASSLVLFMKERRNSIFKPSQLARMFGCGYVVCSKLSKSYITLMKEHPKVVSLLLFMTFPDTSTISKPDIVEWLKATSLSRSVNTIGRGASNFFLRFLSERWFGKYVEPHPGIAGDGYYPAAFQTDKVVRRIDSIGVDKLLEDFKSLREQVLGNAFSPYVRVLEEEEDDRIRLLYGRTLEYIELFDRVRMFSWDRPKEIPSEIAKLSIWLRFKIMTLEGFRKTGVLNWKLRTLRRRLPHGESPKRREATSTRPLTETSKMKSMST